MRRATLVSMLAVLVGCAGIADLEPVDDGERAESATTTGGTSSNRRSPSEEEDSTADEESRREGTCERSSDCAGGELCCMQGGVGRCVVPRSGLICVTRP